MQHTSDLASGAATWYSLDKVFKAGGGLFSGLRGWSDLPLKIQVQLQGTVQRSPGCQAADNVSAS